MLRADRPIRGRWKQAPLKPCGSLECECMLYRVVIPVVQATSWQRGSVQPLNSRSIPRQCQGAFFGPRSKHST